MKILSLNRKHRVEVIQPHTEILAETLGSWWESEQWSRIEGSIQAKIIMLASDKVQASNALRLSNFVESDWFYYWPLGITRLSQQDGTSRATEVDWIMPHRNGWHHVVPATYCNNLSTEDQSRIVSTLVNLFLFIYHI